MGNENRIKRTLKGASNEIFKSGKQPEKTNILEDISNDTYFDYKKAKINNKSKQGDKYRTTILLEEDTIKKVTYLNFKEAIDKTIIHEKSINLLYDIYFHLMDENNINILDNEFNLTLDELKKYL
jgi:hypothetical protein